MKIKFYVLCLFFVFSISIFAQTSDNKKSQSNPILIEIWNFEGEDDSEFVYHKIFEPLNYHFNNDPKGSFATRICSSKSSDIEAFGRRRVNHLVFLLKDKFSSHSDKSQYRIYYLRNDKECRKNNKYRQLEYWFIPSESEFPPFVEVHHYQESSVQSLIYENFYDNGKLYASGKLMDTEEPLEITEDNWGLVLERLVTFIKSRRTAFFYINSSVKNLKTSNSLINQVKKYLKKEGISDFRIKTELCNCSDILEVGMYNALTYSSPPKR